MILIRFTITFLISNFPFDEIVIIFEVDHSSTTHADNRIKNILVKVKDQHKD